MSPWNSQRREFENNMNKHGFIEWNDSSIHVIVSLNSVKVFKADDNLIVGEELCKYEWIEKETFDKKKEWTKHDIKGMFWFQICKECSFFFVFLFLWVSDCERGTGYFLRIKLFTERMANRFIFPVVFWI